MATVKWSRNRKLSITFLGLMFCFIASAAVLIAVAQVWRMETPAAGTVNKHTLRSLSVGTMDLTTATVLGSMILVSAVVGVAGFCDGYGPGKGHRSMGLVVFNWSLIATGIVTVIVGSIIWFFTLRLRRDYLLIWNEQPAATQAFLQDTLQCCGYFNATTRGFLTERTGFCANITNATAIQGCVTPITQFGDFLLQNAFTTIYGFSAIQVALFATSCCLIISRREEDRFRRIDEKLGGLSGGFV